LPAALPTSQREGARHSLGNHANRLSNIVGLRDHVEAIDERRAGSRREERHEHADERRLAGAIRTEEPEYLAGFHVERDPVHGGELAELFDDLPHFDGVHSAQSALIFHYRRGPTPSANSRRCLASDSLFLGSAGPQALPASLRATRGSRYPRRT